MPLPKYSNEDLKKMFSELAAKAQLPDDQARAVLTAFDNDAFAQGAGEAVAFRSDYSRAHDALRKERQEWEQEKSQYLTWYNNATGEYEQMKTTAAEAQAKIKQIEATFGSGTVTQSDTDPFGSESEEDMADRYATPDDVARIVADTLQKFGSNVESLVVKTNMLQSKHMAKWHEPLDIDEFTKYLQENKIQDVDLGYEKYVSPKVEAEKKKEFDEAIERARQEEREKIKQELHFPAESVPSERSPLSAARTKDENSLDPRAEALKAYREHGGGYGRL